MEVSGDGVWLAGPPPVVMAAVTQKLGFSARRREGLYNVVRLRRAVQRSRCLSRLRFSQMLLFLGTLMAGLHTVCAT